MCRPGTASQLTTVNSGDTWLGTPCAAGKSFYSKLGPCISKSDQVRLTKQRGDNLELGKGRLELARRIYVGVSTEVNALMVLTVSLTIAAVYVGNLAMELTPVGN